MGDPVLYGPGFSTYVRSCRLALIEKGVPYRLEEINFLQGMPAEQIARQPFGKVPAFEHDGLALYEAVAICRYVDEAFDGPSLQPADVGERARMTQLLSIMDSYTYPPGVGQVVIQRLVVPMLGGTPDEDAIEAALPGVEKSIGVLEGFAGGGDYLAGGALSLADLHLVPIYTYLSMTPDCESILGAAPALKVWFDRMSARPSVKETVPQLG